MELITAALSSFPSLSLEAVGIPVDRLTLAKRRWRGAATDGREFGFDLEHPLHDGDPVFCDGRNVYRVTQKAEGLVSIPLHGAADAARLGWLLGNLHFRLAATADSVQVPDDPAVRQMLEREHFHYHVTEAVFRPAGGGHTHGHHEH